LSSGPKTLPTLTEAKDPVEWLATFKKVTTINRWIDAARKKTIAGGYLKGAAAD